MDWDGTWERLGLLFELEWLRVGELRIDPHTQRRMRPEKVAAIVDEFDEMGLGVFTVSQRMDGGDYIVDGQHRWQAVAAKGLLRHRVPCARVRGLDLEGERHLFRMLNRERLPLSPYETFQSQLGSDADLAAGVIAEVLASHQIVLVPPRARLGPREVCAIGTLREIDEERGLERTLATLVAGWGDAPGAFKSTYLKAVWLVLKRGWAEEAKLVAFLRRTKPGELDRLALRHQSRPGEKPLQAYVLALRSGCWDMSSEKVITLRNNTG